MRGWVLDGKKLVLRFASPPKNMGVFRCCLQRKTVHLCSFFYVSTYLTAMLVRDHEGALEPSILCAAAARSLRGCSCFFYTYLRFVGNPTMCDLQGTAGHRVDPTSAFDRALLAGARLTAAMRLAVEQELGFTVSAGIASNKVLAKLASSINKPNKQVCICRRES